jgi:NAD(P)-dependent dehydrogenase (short-subunit alcohol dehydrogenase family)
VSTDASAVPGPSFDLTGQIAVVTGANRGLGRDLAVALGAAGATVVSTGRHTDKLEPVASEIRAAGGQATVTALDVAAPASIERGIAEIEARHGRIDILVNNAGLGPNKDAVDVTPVDWDEIMDVNLKGLFFITQAVGRGMLARRYGRIVSISSQAGLVGIRRHAVYSASKGGLNLLTKVLALEWAPFGVTVNAVAPTYIRTRDPNPWLDDPAYLATIVDRIPAGRVATGVDVAGAVVYLASPAAAMVTGTVLPVDGGWTAQ